MEMWVVRHACAGSKGDGRWPDDDRPLDPAGVEQAEALAAVLAPLCPNVLVSSPSSRCVETLRPLADRLGAGISTWPSLRPPDGPSTVERLVRAPVGGLVLCTHGESMEPVIDRFGSLGISVPVRADRNRLLVKGGAWHLNGDPTKGWTLGVVAPVTVRSCPRHP